jgi:phage-related protein
VTKYLEILRALAALLPIVMQLVRQLEEALPTSGAGAAKLAQIKAILQQVFATLSGVTVTFDQVWPTVQALIGGLVGAFNALGVFKKGNTPPAAEG